MTISLITIFVLLLIWELISAVTEKHPDVMGLVSAEVTRGMVIDAGSGGSRLHVYRWKPRVFNTTPPPISYPEADEKWTKRTNPGIHELLGDNDAIAVHLSGLIEAAKKFLKGCESEFHLYPVYFKATGGVRELALEDRESILLTVKKLLSDKSFSPFYFQDDFARVISGEEEAIFSWCATNLIMGNLLPASEGTGVVVPDKNTFGTLDLGGASTQIAFFVPEQDISEGLFKLQIGSQKHWNVYTKSFLQFGVVSARKRHLAAVADSFFYNKNNTFIGDIPLLVDHCFHSGYSEPSYDTLKNRKVDITGPAVPAQDQLYRCMEAVRPLMEKQYGVFCRSVYHGDCSIAGSYQPPIPSGKHGNFIGTSTYRYAWQFLQLPDTCSLMEFEERASRICSMTFGELIYYSQTVKDLGLEPEKLASFLPYYCFLSSYVLVLLRDGYGFRKDQTLTVLDEYHGNKVSWTLGAILYEINTLPWKLDDPLITTKEWLIVILSMLFGFMLGMLAAIAVYSEAISENSRKGRRVLSEESFNDADSTERAPLIRSSTIDIIRNQYQNEDNLSPDRPNNGTNHFISRISHYVPFNGENPNSNTTNPSQK